MLHLGEKINQFRPQQQALLMEEQQRLKVMPVQFALEIKNPCFIDAQTLRSKK